MPDSIYGRLADALRSDWLAHARKEQLPPSGDWSIWLILSGRGWGKTLAGRLAVLRLWVRRRRMFAMS
jgi:phage terminase large subunit-like protein